MDAAYTLLSAVHQACGSISVISSSLLHLLPSPSSSSPLPPLQEEEISLFNKKKAAVQAQRAQSEREQLAKKTKKWFNLELCDDLLLP